MKSQPLPGSRPARRRTISPRSAAPPAEPVHTGHRRWPAPGWIGAAAVVLLGIGIGGWRWQRRSGPLVPPAGTIPLPTEARLLAAAAREPNSSRADLELAEQYAGDGRTASALWAYAEALARASHDDAIRLKLAAALVRLGQVQPAEAALREMVAKKGAAAAQARQDLAELLLSTGRPAEALVALRPLGPEAGALRGRAYEAMGNSTAAAGSYRHVGAAGDPEGYERLARLELALGHLKSAQEAMRSLGEVRSPRPADLLLVAAIHAAAGTPQELDAALDRVLRCLQLQPRSAEAHYQAALLLLRKSDRVAAMQQLQSAVQLDPHHAEARGQLAELLQTEGQTAQAHREWATYYELKDQPDRALAELRRAGAAGFPDDRECTLTMVRIASETDQLQMAVEEAQGGLERHPGDPDLMLQLGLLEESHRRMPARGKSTITPARNEGAGAPASLERLCRDWIALRPASGVPYWLQGRRALNEMQFDQAIHLFETACAKEPGRSDFCEALGVAYLAVPTPENLSRARPWLEKAIVLNPQAPGPHQYLGRVLEHTGDLEGARRQYLQSLDLQPEQTTVLNNLVQVMMRLRRPEVAQLFAELSRQVREGSREHHRWVDRVRDHPADPIPRLDLAGFLMRHGQLAAARDQLERAAESGPAAAPARQTLAEVRRLLRVQSS